MQTATYPDSDADRGPYSFRDGGPQSARGWFRKAEDWLDAKGRWAWIAAMVLGFVFFWPVGLALLAVIIWRGKMSCHSRHRSHWQERGRAWGRGFGAGSGHGFGSSGNSAFDAYRDETLKRLEDEQRAFQEFLDRLRRAKDQTEFDSFMDERRNRPQPPAPETPEAA
jgi:hypothetical protein